MGGGVIIRISELFLSYVNDNFVRQRLNKLGVKYHVMGPWLVVAAYLILLTRYMIGFVVTSSLDKKTMSNILLLKGN